MSLKDVLSKHDFSTKLMKRVEFAEALTEKYKTRELGMIIAQCEIDGGECRNCKEPWTRVEFDEFPYKGYYHVPGCYCYPVCPVCRTYLYEDQLSGKLGDANFRCRTCGHFLLIFREGKKWKNWGREYENNPEVMKRRELFIISKYGRWFFEKLKEKTNITTVCFLNGMIIEPDIKVILKEIKEEAREKYGKKSARAHSREPDREGNRQPDRLRTEQVETGSQGDSEKVQVEQIETSGNGDKGNFPEIPD